MTAAVQTIWADLVAATLADAGVLACVISPGSRSTPLVAALARSGRTRLVTIIDERAAAFYALGAARASGRPVALVCTSGTAAAHYLPAIVEASMAGIPLVALTANRPPELHACGASQTIDQRALYGSFVRADFELGAPVATPLALRGLRRKLVQAITIAVGPDPGPVHIDVALCKPLEPAAPTNADELALADLAARLSSSPDTLIAPPVLAPNVAAIEEVARAIAGEPRGLIVAGAMPVAFAAARPAVFELATRTGYPIVAEAGSQLRCGPRPDGVMFVDHFDLIGDAPAPGLIVQLGAEPVAASWPAYARGVGARWVLAGPRWRDPDSSATGVILGDEALAVGQLTRALSEFRTRSSDLRTARRNVERGAASLAWRDDWRALEDRAVVAVDHALAEHPASETAVLAAAAGALPAGAILQLGNSLPIRSIDHVAPPAGLPGPLVITQRGAAGIDGLIASAAGATLAGRPVLLVLGDVSFAHDLGGLLAARELAAPLAILVIDNVGGQIFAGLPLANAGLGGDAFARHWLTAPGVDPIAIAAALGHRAVVATSPAAAAGAIAAALADLLAHAVTVIHAPVTAAGARAVRTAALQHLDDAPAVLAQLGGQS